MKYTLVPTVGGRYIIEMVLFKEVAAISASIHYQVFILDIVL